MIEAHPECEVGALSDPIEAKLVIVRQPGILEYVERQECSVRARRGAIIANTTPVFPGGKDVAFDLIRCAENFERLFDCDARVYPESGVTRNLLNDLGYGSLLEKNNWAGMAPTRFQPMPLSDPDRKRPVVGRHSRDHWSKWPERLETAQQTYFNPDAYDTAILGGIDEIPYKIPQPSLSATRVIPFGEEDPVEFLKGIDFFIHYPSSAGKESFGMSTVEALASGRVAVLPPYMETTFGSAALYCDAADVERLVHELWSDKERYIAQARRGSEFVEQNFRGIQISNLVRNLTD